MAQRIGFVAASYPIQQVHEQLSACLPRHGLARASEDGRCRWTPRLLTIAAVVTAWQSATSVGERFQTARQVLTQMFVSRRRAGDTYRGFIAALTRCSATLLATLLPWWRQRLTALDEGCGRVGRWALFGVDGTKLNAPRTDANVQAFGCGGKSNGPPQQLLTMLVHVGSWMPWAWRRGPVKNDERTHLLSMIDDLPDDAMLLADALYTGYDLLQRLNNTSQAFVVRVGANVKLLRKLGYIADEHDQIVYLWPVDRQRNEQPPLVLRLIRLQDERSRQMCLLTNVLDRKQLPDRMAAQMYAQRWGVEVLHRTLKRTLMRHTLQSQNPKHAEVELDWNVAALIVLALINLRTAVQHGADPQRRSAATAVRLLRRWMRAAPKLRRTTLLRQQLAKAEIDQYRRAGPKAIRPWTRKKQTQPPGTPSARRASESEVELAKQVRSQSLAS